MTEQLLDVTIDVGGIPFGYQDDNGVQWWWESITGWFEPPPSVSTIADREGGNGATRGPMYYRQRTVSIKGQIAHDSDVWQVGAAAERLAALLASGEFARMTVNAPHLGLRWAEVQRQEVKTDWAGAYTADFQVTLVAPDYRRYGDEQVVTSPMPSGEVGGLDDEGGMDDTGTLDAGNNANIGNVTVTNHGTVESEPVFKIYGGTTGVPAPIVISHGNTGQQLIYDGGVAAGDFLLFKERQVLYNGISSRRELLSRGQWMTVKPQETVTFNWGNGGGSAGDGRLEATVASAYL